MFNLKSYRPKGDFRNVEYSVYLMNIQMSHEQ